MANYLLLVLIALCLNMVGAVPLTAANVPQPVVPVASEKDRIVFSDEPASTDIPPVANLQLCGARDFHQPCIDIAFLQHTCLNLANMWPGHGIFSARPKDGGAWCYMYPVPDCQSLDEDGKRPIFLKWGISDFEPYNGKIESWICFPSDFRGM